MKKITLFAICLLTILSCKSDEISVNKLVGEWYHTNMYNGKDANGQWGEWYELWSLAAVPTLGFTADGKILRNGKPLESCCDFKNYKLIEDSIILSNPGLNGCETSFCYPCNSWKIAKLSNDFLEIEFCNSAARYRKLIK